MNAHFDIEHKREAWRDWFIIDDPVKTSKLHIWCDGHVSFDIDPSFCYYKVSGYIDKDDPPNFVLSYLFETDMSLEKKYVFCFRKVNDDTKYFEINLKRKGNE